LERNLRLLVKFFVLLDLPIPARGEIIFVRFHLILRHPELARKLVDLRLQRRDAGLEFGKFGLGFLAGDAGLVSRLGDDLFEFEPVDDGVMFEAVLLQWGNLLLQVGQTLGSFLLELRIPPVAPAIQHVGNIALGDLLAFVVQ
jgi:hypothetical protein